MKASARLSKSVSLFVVKMLWSDGLNAAKINNLIIEEGAVALG